ncbi:MAG: DUF4349 domain-containing protein [Chloroflexota bacterium]
MTRSTTTLRGRAALVLSLLVMLVLVIGCAGAASAPEANRDNGKPAPGLPGQPLGGEAPGTDASGGGDPNLIFDAARPDLLIIKTGDLELQVKAIEDSTAAATNAIVALGGYVSGSQQYGDEENLTASITYRIPSAKWDEAVAMLRGLAIKVLSAQTQTQDVTGQVVDLTARIDNLKVSERALQSIMSQATKIADVLAVQTELTTVRGEIERATAEKQHLQEQASLSTLTVRFTLKPDPALLVSQQKFDPKDQVDRATASLVEVLQGLATAGIWFAIVWLPIVLVLAVIAGLVAWVLRRRNVFGRTATVEGGSIPAAAAPSPSEFVATPRPSDDADATSSEGSEDR